MANLQKHVFFVQIYIETKSCVKVCQQIESMFPWSVANEQNRITYCTTFF